MTHSADPIAQSTTGWGFWDETWSHWHGGYSTEADARAALKRYALELEYGPRGRPLTAGEAALVCLGALGIAFVGGLLGFAAFMGAVSLFG